MKSSEEFLSQAESEASRLWREERERAKETLEEHRRKIREANARRAAEYRALRAEEKAQAKRAKQYIAQAMAEERAKAEEARREEQRRREEEMAAKAARTPLNRLSKKRVALILLDRDSPERRELEAARPRTRADCVGGLRPCPFVSCRHNLYLDVNSRTGNLKLRNKTIEPEDVPPEESCSLDVADQGPHTLAQVGAFFVFHRERSRQVEEMAIKKLRAKLERAGIESLDFERGHPDQWEGLGNESERAGRKKKPRVIVDEGLERLQDRAWRAYTRRLGDGGVDRAPGADGDGPDERPGSVVER